MMRGGVRWVSARGEVAVCLTTALNGLGFNAQQTWAWRRAEVAAHAPSPFRDASGEPLTEVSVQTLPPSLFGAARVQALAGNAFEAVAAVLDGPEQGARVAIALGLPEAQGLAASVAAPLRARLAAYGSRVSWSEHPGAHASFAAAVAAAAASVERDEVDLAVVGGADSYHDPDRVASLLASGRILHGAQVDGMIPGEGAAFALLTRPATARRLGLAPRARVEAAAFVDEAGAAGGGMTRALAQVFEGVRAQKEAVDWWIHDLTGEPFRAREAALWLPRASAGVASERCLMEGLPALLGDLGAATMPTAAAVALEGFTRRAVDASRCVLLGSSPEGARGAVLLARGG